MTQPPLTHPATNPDGTCDDQNCPCHEFTRMPTATTTNDDDTISDCEPERPKINYSEYMRTFKYPPPQPPEPPETIKVVIRAATSDDWIGVAYQKDYTGDPSTIHEYRLAERDSPALRRTRSITHHAEMVEEQKRREDRKCSTCGHLESQQSFSEQVCYAWIKDPTGKTVGGICGHKCIFPDTARRERRVDSSHPFTPAQPGMKLCCYGDDATNLCRQPREAPVHQRSATFEHAWAELNESDRRVTERAVAEKMYFAGRRDREAEFMERYNEDLREMQRVARERMGR